MIAAINNRPLIDIEPAWLYSVSSASEENTLCKTIGDSQVFVRQRVDELKA
jgi:hypothetical protein